MESEKIYKDFLLKIEEEIYKALQVDPKLLDPNRFPMSAGEVILRHSLDSKHQLQIERIDPKDFYKPIETKEQGLKA